MAALAVEQAAIASAIGNCSVLRWQGLTLHVGQVAGQQVLVFPISRMGTAPAAQAAERVIRDWLPARLMLVGIAAGVPASPADMRPGDVLVADQIVGYELAKVTRDSTERRYEVYRCDAELLEHARSLRPADWADEIAIPRPDDPSGRFRPLVHIGPVLTGDKVLADGATLAELRLAWPKAIGAEMEGLGAALAAYQNGIGFLMVKAVTDFADDGKSDTWRRYAAAAAARFAVAVLARSHPSGPDGPQSSQPVIPPPETRPIGQGHQAAAPAPAGDERSAAGRAAAAGHRVKNHFYAPVEAGTIGISFGAEPGEQP